MKNVLILIFFFAIILFADEIEKPESNIRVGTDLKFDKGYISLDFGESCSKSFINCIDSIYIWDSTTIFTGIAYYSTLDTNYAVFVNFEENEIIMHRISCRSQSVNDLPVKDILRNEFLKLQEWGVVQLTKDSAEHLIDRMIANMTSDSYDIVGVFYTHGFICDTLWDCGGLPVDGGAIMIDNWWTLLPDEKPTSVSKTPIKNRFRLSRMNYETFFVEGINEATPYKVFDVNGILLKQGITENGEVQVPKTPSILDIEHKKVLLK